MLTAGAAGVSLAAPHSAPPTRRGAGCPLPVGHRLQQGGHGAHSLQARGRSNLGAGAARRPCGGLGWKESPGRARSRPGHGLSARSPSCLPGSWLCSSQASPVPHAGSLPPSRGHPQAQDARVCRVQRLAWRRGRPAQAPGGKRAPQRSRTRLSRIDAQTVCSGKSCVAPACRSWASRPVEGSPRGFWEWPTQRGGHTAERAGGLACPPPIGQDAGPSPRPAGHGAPGVWQLLSSHWKGRGGTVGGAWSCPSRAACS